MSYPTSLIIHVIDYKPVHIFQEDSALIRIQTIKRRESNIIVNTSAFVTNCVTSALYWLLGRFLAPPHSVPRETEVPRNTGGRKEEKQLTGEKQRGREREGGRDRRAMLHTSCWCLGGRRRGALQENRTKRGKRDEEKCMFVLK